MAPKGPHCSPVSGQLVPQCADGLIVPQWSHRGHLVPVAGVGAQAGPGAHASARDGDASGGGGDSNDGNCDAE